MRSVVFCTSFIDEKNQSRYKNWINYYQNKLKLFHAEKLFLIDDGSSAVNFDERIEIINSDYLPDTLDKDICLFHFDKHLGRPGRRDYQGWWRSFTFSSKLAEKYNIDKFIHIESDYFVLSREMMNYIANVSEGWTVFYSQFYNFPETAIQIICNDSFDKLNNIYQQALASDYKFKKIAERTLPFSKVEKSFTGDRLGEIKVLRGWLKKYKLPLEIDYVGQINEKDDPEVFRKFLQLHL